MPFNQGAKKTSTYSNGSQQATTYYTVSRRELGDLQRKSGLSRKVCLALASTQKKKIKEGRKKESYAFLSKPRRLHALHNGSSGCHCPKGGAFEKGKYVHYLTKEKIIPPSSLLSRSLGK